MPTKPKNIPMSYDEMVADGVSKKANKLYRQETAEFSDRQISAIVERAAAELETTESKNVSLDDIKAVRAVTRNYLESCVETSTVPSISGLCRALGCSRTAYYNIVNAGRPKETAEFFEMAHDSFSDILAQASLRGAVQPVVAIFLEKALFGYNERVEIVTAQKQCGPLGDAPDMARLEEKLKDVVVEDA